MTKSEADKLFEQVQAMNLLQICKLWRWITLELGKRVTRRANADFRRGEPDATNKPAGESPSPARIG